MNEVILRPAIGICLIQDPITYPSAYTRREREREIDRLKFEENNAALENLTTGMT